MSQMEFRIDLSPGRASYWYGERGGEPVEELTNIDLVIDDLTLNTAKLLESWLNVWDRIGIQSTAVLKPDTFKIIGTHLWMLILDNEIGTKLKEKIEIDHDPPLQVLINFEDHVSGDLRSLPWEFLCLPNTEDFLATSTRLLLVRFAPSTARPGTRVDRATNKLGVQFVTALPRAAKYEVVNERIRALQKDLVNLPNLDVYDLIEEFRTGDIEAALQNDARPCHVVHITGLCRGEPGYPKLWLDAENGAPAWQDPRPLIDALTSAGGKLPRLVILQLSETEEGDADENFERLAPELIRRGIPAVLAMQYTLPPRNQSIVWTKFYKDLSEKMPVGKAVQLSRYGMLHGRLPNREFGTPVVYLREDGPLVEQGDDSARPATEGRGDRGATPFGSANPVRRQMQRALADVSPNLFDGKAIEVTRRWLATVPLDGTVPDARAKIRAFLRQYEGDHDINDLGLILGASLAEFERGSHHDRAS
jgi:hypothetical protein